MNNLNTVSLDCLKLKYLSSINDETLPEDTDPDWQFNYIDIGNVDSNGNIDSIVPYRFDQAPSRARRVVKEGDVIISTVRTYLKAITSIDFKIDNLIVSTGFAVVRPKADVFNPRFCKYALRQSEFLDEVQRRSVGVSYPAINASDLGDIKIPVPSIEKQEQLANYLDVELNRIKSLIQAKESQLTLLSEKRQALITRAVTKGIKPKVKLIDSRINFLGEMPEHWKILQLKYLSDIPLQYGANEAALDDNPNNPRFVRITDIDEDGNLRPETFKSLEPEIAAPYLLEDGDVLFARSGATVGKSFMYQASWGIACFAGYLIRMRCNQKKILPKYMNFITQSNYYWTQVNAGLIQATIQNFSGEKYGSMKILLPPLVEQEKIVAFLETEVQVIESIKRETLRSIGLLKEKITALITAAVTGQLQIANENT
jgi:type I restriction enzyme S subunit